MYSAENGDILAIQGGGGTSLGGAKRQLAEAKAHLKVVAGAGSIEQLRAAWDHVTDAERELARLRGEQYAVPVNVGLAWDTGAPLPHIIAASGQALVLFYRAVPDPRWDGTSVQVVEPGSPEPAALGLIEFTNVHSVKFGGPNDEAIEGHALYGRGLTPYSAHEVVRSQWITEEERINSVHPMHRGGWHDRLHHYVLCFHDDMMECLAEGWRSESLDCSLSEALQRAAGRLLHHTLSP
jgi:hypothetical protein